MSIFINPQRIHLWTTGKLALIWPWRIFWSPHRDQQLTLKLNTVNENLRYYCCNLNSISSALENTAYRKKRKFRHLLIKIASRLNPRQTCLIANSCRNGHSWSEVESNPNIMVSFSRCNGLVYWPQDTCNSISPYSSKWSIQSINIISTSSLPQWQQSFSFHREPPCTTCHATHPWTHVTCTDWLARICWRSVESWVGDQCHILEENITSDQLFTWEVPQRLPPHLCDIAIGSVNKGRVSFHHFSFKGLRDIQGMITLDLLPFWEESRKERNGLYTVS